MQITQTINENIIKQRPWQGTVGMILIGLLGILSIGKIIISTLFTVFKSNNNFDFNVEGIMNIIEGIAGVIMFMIFSSLVMVFWLSPLVIFLILLFLAFKKGWRWMIIVAGVIFGLVIPFVLTHFWVVGIIFMEYLIIACFRHPFYHPIKNIQINLQK